jgi:hypothetical protein
MTMDYSSLVGAGQSVTSLTLGIAADDFQFPVFGQPFIVTVDGSPVLTLSIDEGGDGGDGWAVDFLTLGVETTATGTPEPGTALLGAIGVLALLSTRRALMRR